MKIINNLKGSELPRDILGVRPKVGDFICGHYISHPLGIDEIVEIKIDRVLTKKGWSFTTNNFLIVNCLIDENPERFV